MREAGNPLQSGQKSFPSCPPHKLWKAGEEPRLSHHSNTARQTQVQQTSRRAFHVRKKLGRNKIFNTDFPKTSASLSTVCFCINRQDAYTALANMPGRTALIPPRMDPKDRPNMFSMCAEAFLFPGSFTQAEISLRTHTFNFSKNDEQYKLDEHFSPWGLLDHCNKNYMDCPVWIRNSFISAPSERIGPNKSIADIFKPIHYENNERWLNSLGITATVKSLRKGEPPTR